MVILRFEIKKIHYECVVFTVISKLSEENYETNVLFLSAILFILVLSIKHTGMMMSDWKKKEIFV